MNDYNDGISLSELFRILIRRMHWIVVVTIVILLIGIAYAFTRPPVYETTIKIEIEGLRNLGIEIPAYFLTPIVNVDGSITYRQRTFTKSRVTDLTLELEYLTNPKTIVEALQLADISSYSEKHEKYTEDANKFIKDLKKRIEITPIKGTNFAVLNFYDSDERFATTFLCSLVDAFEQRLINTAMVEKQASLEVYQSELLIAQKNFEDFQRLYGDVDDQQDEEMIAKMDFAKQQLLAVEESVELTTYQINHITKAVTVLEELTLLESSSKGTKKSLILAVALLLGGALGVLAALVIDMAKDTIDAEDLLLRVLPQNNSHVESMMAFTKKNGDLVAEQPSIAPIYTFVAANLLFGEKPVKERIFTVTSASKEAGSTFTVANMGVALAHSGKKVLLIDANGTDKNLASYFDISDKKGLSDYVLKNDESKKLAVNVATNLHVLPLGSTTHTELLQSPNFAQRLDLLSKEYDITLIDAPSFDDPIGVLSLSEYTEGVLLVIRSHQSRKRETEQILSLLQSTNTPLLGVLFNGYKTPWYAKNSLAASSKEFKNL